jgi:hypothetical protein
MTGVEIALAVLAVVAVVASATTTIVLAEAAEKRAKRNAKRLEEQGKIALAQRRRKGQQLLAAQRAAIGATGLEPLGTPLDVLSSTAAEEELAAQREKFRFEDAAFVIRERAKIEKRNQFISAGITLLGGVSTGASQVLGSSPNKIQPQFAPVGTSSTVFSVNRTGLTKTGPPRVTSGLTPTRARIN